MSTTRTDISDTQERGRMPINLRPPIAKVNLMELRELVEAEYTQLQISIFTRKFSNKPRQKVAARSQVSKFLWGKMDPEFQDWLIIKRTLEWLFGIEIEYIHEPTLGTVAKTTQLNTL